MMKDQYHLALNKRVNEILAERETSQPDRHIRVRRPFVGTGPLGQPILRHKTVRLKAGDVANHDAVTLGVLEGGAIFSVTHRRWRRDDVGYADVAMLDPFVAMGTLVAFGSHLHSA